LVATSGDTGGAVAAAFNESKKGKVVILYPKGLVSEFQEKQLTCWGKNVVALRVQGSFDDCQRIVKSAFASDELKSKNLTSANSINIGRILPQVVYYAFASLLYFRKVGRRPGFIVPTGNVGNALACVWAKKMGFPIENIVMACNANKAVIDYLKTGEISPRPAVATLANAMDVGNPSNLERLKDLYPKLSDLKKFASAYSVTDQQISETLIYAKKTWGKIFCPHTATAIHTLGHLPSDLKDRDWIIVATAHPAKFQNVIEPLIKEKLSIPKTLEAITQMPSNFKEINADLKSLTSIIKTL